MISLLALAVAPFAQGVLPIQFVPKSQFAFERKDTILESSSGQTAALVLVNDENVSNEILEAVTKHPDFVRIVELVRKEAAGTLTFWNPTGKVVNDNQIAIPTAEADNMEPGEVSLIVEMPQAAGIPKSASDKPTISCSFAGAKSGRGITTADRKYYSLSKIGIPKFAFSNLRVSIQSRSFAGSFDAAPGTTKTISDVGFKVVGPTVSIDDKLEHFQVMEAGFVGMDNLAMVGLFDWDRIEKEVAPVRNRNEVVQGKLIKKGTEAPDPKEMYFDFSTRRPVKYLTSFAVIRSSSIQGFFQHIATQPRG